ncbi:hypothetical protein EV363DRAFT_1418107, partial [Boletus edulis]
MCEPDENEMRPDEVLRLLGSARYVRFIMNSSSKYLDNEKQSVGEERRLVVHVDGCFIYVFATWLLGEEVIVSKCEAMKRGYWLIDSYDSAKKKANEPQPYSYYYDLVLPFFNTMNKLGVVTNYSESQEPMYREWYCQIARVEFRVPWVSSSTAPVNFFFASARREVILSAGALQTPQILELSGIGNPNINILRKLGIPLKVDLPGHFAHERLREYREMRRGMLSSTLSSLVFIPASIFIPADTMKRMLAWLDRALQTPEIKDSPYKQWYDLQRAWLENDGVAQLEIILFPSYTHVGCTKVSVFLQHAGTVNPARACFRCDPPEIDLATLDSPGDIDMTMLLEAIKYTFKVMEAGALGDLTAKIVESLPTWSDDQLREVDDQERFSLPPCARYSGDAPEVCQWRRGQRAQGTLAPSKRKETHVYGTANLRVADASILPIHLESHPQATLYGLPHRVVADIISQQKATAK